LAIARGSERIAAGSEGVAISSTGMARGAVGLGSVLQLEFRPVLP